MTLTSRNTRKWTDEQLVHAVAINRSWRAVARTLGLKSTSTNVVRRHARRLELDTSHFIGQRSWSDAELRHALAVATTWSDVLRDLDLNDCADARVRVKGRAVRLGLNVTHLSQRPSARLSNAEDFVGQPDPSRLRAAAQWIATAWFSMWGMPASIPVEPQAYDLLVSMPDGIKRVQVKSTTHRANGKWLASIGRRPYALEKTASRAPYDPDSVDFFLVINGAGELYLIPSRVVAGRTGVQLDSYPQYRVGTVAGLFAGNTVSTSFPIRRAL